MSPTLANISWPVKPRSDSYQCDKIHWFKESISEFKDNSFPAASIEEKEYKR
ncbi:MAG: hypothetical protein AAGB12_04705 [Pseudomonadota bacterium]